jgi:hypothetical protein
MVDGPGRGLAMEAARALRAQPSRRDLSALPLRWVRAGEIHARRAEIAALEAVLLPAESATPPRAYDWPARTAAARADVAGSAALGGALLGVLGGTGVGIAAALLGGQHAGVLGALPGSVVAALVATAAAGAVGVAARAVFAESIVLAVAIVLPVLGSVGGALWGIFLAVPDLDVQETIVSEGFTQALVGGMSGLLCGLFVGCVLVLPLTVPVVALCALARKLARLSACAAGRAVSAWGRLRSGVVAGAGVGGVVYASGTAAEHLGVQGAVGTAATLGGALGPVVGGVAGAVTVGAARWRSVWLSPGDDGEAVMFLFWPRRREILAVSSPALVVSDGRLHSALCGPAVSFPWRQAWFWRGNALTAAAIATEPRPAERRAMLACYGLDRYLRGLNAKRVREDQCGTLWYGHLDLSDRGPSGLVADPVVLVELRDSTSGERSLLRVPPTTLTPRDGVAWSFRLAPKEYQPAAEA